MENCISVSQLNKYIKNIFDKELMLQNISVFGEIGNYTVSNGIAYFNLKDNENLLQCVLFNANRFETPKLGDMVLLTGSINYYAKGGKLSFNAVNLRPYGRGLLYEAFLKLKEELEAKGYFAIDRKKPIPDRIKRIGVVSSPTGAVIQDIIDVTSRRNNTIDIVLYPVRVQGVGAEYEIANGINFFSDYEDIDVVIVARGGGSLEDLQPFNTEVVAEATFKCKKPIVSAVGHETDYTIIDFVADLRAPTPSAAAELVAWSKEDTLNGILKLVARMEKSLNQILNFNISDIDKNEIKINNFLLNKISKSNNYLDSLYQSMQNMIDKKILVFENKLQLLVHSIEKLNPRNLLDKGYTKIEINGASIKSVESLHKDDIISFNLKDGKVFAFVKDIKKESNKNELGWKVK